MPLQTKEEMEIRLANLEDLEGLAILFDRYRIFYGQASDLEAAKQFLRDRLINGDSVIFMASENEQCIGFTQLYPSFSSVSMKRIWILNDLFVEQRYRRQGIATALMNKAENYARDTGAARIALSTQISNTCAQTLYRSRNYTKDEAFYHYQLPLP